MRPPREPVRRQRTARPAWHVLMAQLEQELSGAIRAPAQLERPLARVAAALGFDILLHYQPLDRPERLTLAVSLGLEPAVRDRVRDIRLGDFPCGVVALRRERLVIEEPPVGRGFDLDATGIRCYVGVPLMARGVLLGTLAFCSRERRRIRPQDLELIDAFGSCVACRLSSLRRERRLERACQSLGTANRRKDEFLAVLAHELRNPLAPIRTAVQTIELVGGQSPAVKRASEIIDRQVTHLAGLVDDLLDAARIGRGKLTLEAERIDLNEVARDAIEACRPLVTAAQHELVVAVAEQPCPVAGDFTRLTQVVRNLLSNAVKFTPPGGRIEVIVSRDGASSSIRVRDNGRGMDAATLAHVFDMFYQGTRDGDRSGGGLGIGLSLVKSLVDLHRGSVQAVSEGRGRGCEFIVRLPSIVDALPVGLTETSAGAPRRKVARRIDDLRRPKRRTMHEG